MSKTALTNLQLAKKECDTKGSNFSIDRLIDTLTLKLSCSSSLSKRRKVSISGNITVLSDVTPSLTLVYLSFSSSIGDKEDRSLETLAKNRCKFCKYDEIDRTWSRDGRVCTALLGKDLRRGINYGVVWLIIKLSIGDELISHPVEPNASYSFYSCVLFLTTTYSST